MFVMSKVIWTLTQPGTLLLALCAIGLLLTLRRRASRWGRWLLIAGIGGFAAIAVLPLGTWLMRPLENRFPPPYPMPAEADGVIVLGGAINIDISVDRDTPVLKDGAARMTSFVALARRYPKAKLVFTGGSGTSDVKYSEAFVAGRLLAEMGVGAGRLTLEDRSRNTRENALFSRRLVVPKPGERWLLVTSAADLPRAVGCFRAVGWPVIPVPVDYHTLKRPAPFFPGLITGLRQTDWAMHEWLGLVYYRLRGWTPSLFPGPQ